jgi:hypothetical protein
MVIYAVFLVLLMWYGLFSVELEVRCGIDMSFLVAFLEWHGCLCNYYFPVIVGLINLPLV